jgi:hypothetical protein
MYGVAVVRETADSIASGCICEFTTVGGGVRTVAHGIARKLAGVPPAVQLARAGNRFAMVPAYTAAPFPGPTEAPGGTNSVQLRSLPSGALTTTFAPDGIPIALALTSRFAFVLVANSSTVSLSVEVHDARTGVLVRSVQVPAGAEAQLAAAGARVAFHDRHSVWLLDAVSGRRTTVATSTWQVTQVAMQDSTVFWAERRRRPGTPGTETSRKDFFGRIRAAQLGAG